MKNGKCLRRIGGPGVEASAKGTGARGSGVCEEHGARGRGVGEGYGDPGYSRLRGTRGCLEHTCFN